MAFGTQERVVVSSDGPTRQRNRHPSFSSARWDFPSTPIESAHLLMRSSHTLSTSQLPPHYSRPRCGLSSPIVLLKASLRSTAARMSYTDKQQPTLPQRSSRTCVHLPDLNRPTFEPVPEFALSSRKRLSPLQLC